MQYCVRLHVQAEAEIDQIYVDVSDVAGPAIAGNYVAGLYRFLESFQTFPKRGTVREGPVAGLRLVGYRRRCTVAFVVEHDVVTILGIFQRGRNITPEMLEDRVSDS